MPTAEEVRQQLAQELLDAELTYVKALHACLTVL